MLNKKQQEKAAEILSLYTDAMHDDLQPKEQNELKDISRQLADGTGVKCDIVKPEFSKGKEKPVKEKRKRAPTARGTFMGYCMRGADKGGEGKPMGECSTDWKELSQELKDTYIEEK